jgi:hypothetical protein
MGSVQAVNIAVIQCIVGQIQVGNRWGILDLSYECARISFVDEDESGSDDE